MKNVLNISCMLIALGFASCQKEVKVIDENSNEITAANLKAHSLPTVSLRVTVSNVDALGNAYNITNDGKGDYINGVDNVQAVLDQYGTFAFNTKASSRKAAVRYVTYDFKNPVDPNNAYRPTPSKSNNYHFSTGGATTGTQPFIPIQNLGINGNASTECIYMGNGISNGTTSWRVSFRKGCENTQTSLTALAVVTRTKIKANNGVDEWVIQPLGLCSPEANNNIAALRIDDGTSCTVSLKGYYSLPFFFTLTGN